jgi:hypothetical protein
MNLRLVAGTWHCIKQLRLGWHPPARRGGGKHPPIDGGMFGR